MFFRAPFRKEGIRYLTVMIDKDRSKVFGLFPPCCVEDPKPEGCGTGEYPECEKAVPVVASATSTSNALVFSLAALVGAHVVAYVTGMW